ncbi:MAG: hypothetical protein V4462_15430 [Pseudomonadota bacterium]
MMRMHVTENIIEEIIVSTYGEQLDARQRHVFGQALQGLVRLAKAEQLLDIRLDAQRAAGLSGNASARRQTRAILRRIGLDLELDQVQRKLEFGDSTDTAADDGPGGADLRDGLPRD